MHVCDACRASTSVARQDRRRRVYPDGMVELDGLVAALLKDLDDLGIANNTIVVFTTDNGAADDDFPDGGQTPFRCEKEHQLGRRLSACRCVIRWPGAIQPGTVYNEIVRHTTTGYRPSRRRAAIPASWRMQGRNSAQIGNKTYKVHLDGYNQSEFSVTSEDETTTGPERAQGVHLLPNDDGQLVAIRVRVNGSRCSWSRRKQRTMGFGRGSSRRCACRRYSICAADPFERGDKSTSTTSGWQIGPSSSVPMQAIAANWLSSFKEFPVRQNPASFNLDEVMQELQAVGSGSR